MAYTTHNTLDGNYHDVFAPSCDPDEVCSCGYKYETLAHPAYTPSVANGDVKYACVECGTSYTLDGSCYSDGVNKNFNGINAGTNGVHEYISDGTADYRADIWAPQAVNINDGNGFVDFSAANNAVGFLSFDVSAYHNNRLQIQLVGKMNAEVNNNWDAKNAIQDPIFRISTPTDNGNGTYTVTAYGLNSTVLKTFTVTADNMFTAMTNFAMRIYFEGDDIVIDYFVEGAYKTTAKTACTLTGEVIRTMNLVCNSTIRDQKSGFYIDNFYFGYIKG